MIFKEIIDSALEQAGHSKSEDNSEARPRIEGFVNQYLQRLTSQPRLPSVEYTSSNRLAKCLSSRLAQPCLRRHGHSAMERTPTRRHSSIPKTIP